MRMSELSGATGIPVATVKYYLREGLLPAGTPISATSAVYDGTHVERLRLIRALIEGAALSIAQVRRVTQTLDNPPDTFAGRRTSGAATGAAIAETSRSTG